MTILGAIPLDMDTVLLDLFDTSAAGSMSAGSGRSGGNALLCTSGFNTKTLAATVSTLNVAFASNGALGGGSGFLELRDAGTAQVNCVVAADGTITVRRGTVAGTVLGTSAAGAISSSVYQHVEVAVTISATVGTVQIWVNSVSVLNLTGQNTKATANTTVSQFSITGFGGSTVVCDIIWADARIGDRRVECVMPTGAGSNTGFTPSTGANYQNVDEVPPNNDTDYNESSVAGTIDTFTHAAMSGVPVTIDAVIVNVRARNTTTGAGSVAPVLKSGATTSVGAAVSLNTSYQDFQTVYPTDPSTGLAWASAAAVNATEIGYKKTV